MFSNHERELLKTKAKYGTVVERLGKDSLKSFDCCSLCLGELINNNPVSCYSGHLFCKACVLSSLIDQKKEIKRKQTEYEQREKNKQHEKELETQKKQQNNIKEFEKNVITLEGVGDTSTTTSTTTTTTTSPTTDNNTNIEIVEKVIKLNSYWVPGVGQSSSDNNKEIEKPRNYTICTADKHQHPLKSSQLINVHFKQVTTTNDSKDTSNKYCCPICEKVLSNSTKTRLLKRCGHVYCACLDQFSKSSSSKSSSKSSTSDDDNLNCYVCDKPYSKSDIIILSSSGTGFSASGATLLSSKYKETAII